MDEVLRVRGLSKSYGQVTALESLSFSVGRGQIFGLLGPNGAGKSTSIDCILGIKKPDQGEVRIFGDKNQSRRKKKAIFESIGVQFQETGWQDKIKVEEICRVTASLYKNPARWQELLPVFGLTDFEKRTVGELSGGERQRLAVLLALIPSPELVFLDELTTGLDTKARREVWAYLKTLQQNGLSVLLTSHFMEEVETLCDQILILNKGKTIISGTKETVVAQSPCQSLEDAYLFYTGGAQHESL